MAKRSEFSEIAYLCGQCRLLEHVIKVLDNGGTIMQVAAGFPMKPEAGELPDHHGTSVPTWDIQFPPETVLAIKELLKQKYVVCDEKLKQMGME